MSRPLLIPILLALSLHSLAAEARIERSAKAVRAFKYDNPCPETGSLKGACPGWVIDHVVPLCAGGADEPSNMQWQTVQEANKKDVLERQMCNEKRGGE